MTRDHSYNCILLTNQNTCFIKINAHARLLKAAAHAQRVLIEGDILGLAWCTSQGSLLYADMTGSPSGRKLFVGGLPPKVDEKALRDVFARFWHIEEGL